MSRSISILAVVLLASTLAGCLGGSAPSETPTENASPDVVEDPDNYTYVDNASFESGGHVHDYWDGRDELTVIDRTERFGQLSLAGQEGLEQIGVMRPPAGTVIPQGTETVEVTVSWETRYGGDVYENPELRVRTAKDRDFHHAADISNGDTVKIASSNDQNDLPHRQLSGWAFAVYVEPGETTTGTLWYQADVTMEVIAHRGLELPVFPAHPDHWQGRSKIDLLEDAPGTMVWDPENPVYGSSCTGSGCSGPTDGAHRPDNGTIVPFDADVVRVELEPTTQSPTRVGLAYHGANAWDFTRLDPDDTDGRTRIYTIPVTPETADGPYNDQSLWRFRPYITEPVEDGVYVGGYRMSATVHQDAG